MKVLMLPHLKTFRSEESGIKRVVEAYFQYLPQFGVELVTENDGYDLVAVHAGQNTQCDISHNHGLYWTADYPAVSWEWAVNAQVIESLRLAKEITVPSEWVAESIRRDMRRNPHVIGHGIDWALWQHDGSVGDYVLWNKNRKSDVCDPRPVTSLAKRMKQQHFVTTFATEDRPNNINELGVVPHEQMMQLVQNAAVYLSTVKETFGIGILEATAAGVPVLGYGHGGILDLVEHGVSGYLAEPGNLDDLAEGLDYCLRHRKVLGQNGREAARAFVWEKAIEKVAGVYRLAAETEQARVTVVVPTFNYAGKVGRAIESVLSQTFEDFELFVVDDGSTDDTEQAATRFSDKRVHYVRQDNSGVAMARNNGIARGTAPFVCCLDADDALEPEFLETCVGALVQDNGLGIAYTRLRYILPSGEEGISPWPGEWDFDAQLGRKNQVPTCCVFRRDMWESLGGYRSRYCPEGAGSEDAEFWTRCGAYGWRAELVTERPLFVYSWKSGQVSGQERYSEVDWLAWHPWAEDGQHPFASHAKPKKFSHPVRQYDEPVVSVVVPVGPGHEKDVQNALDSLEAQTFRSWEVIVVWDTPDREELKVLTAAFPYVNFLTGQDPKGAGAARNAGAAEARAPFLLFLDADDWLYPEALEKMVQEWEARESIVYTDYVGKAFVSKEHALKVQQSGRLLQWNEDSGEAVIAHQAFDYDWQRAQRQPEDKPYIWCNITSLVPKKWHDEVGGFDESMKSWEDVDYWYRLARAGRPFARIDEPLLVYRFYSGSRRDRGVSMGAELIAYMREKYEEVATVPCQGCGGRRKPPSASRKVPVAKPLSLSDEDFSWYVHVGPNRNMQPLVGGAGFDERIKDLHMIKGRGGQWQIHYGMRKAGDMFLVHREDAVLMAHLLRPAEDKRPREEKQPPPAPIAVEPEAAVPTDWKPTVAQTATINGPVDLQKIPGVTSGIAEQLEADGVTSLAAFVALGEEGLQGYSGVGPVKARSIMRAVQQWSA